MFSLKTSMLKNIDVFQTLLNTNFPPIILHSYHILHSRTSGLCSVYIIIWSKHGGRVCRARSSPTHMQFREIKFLITPQNCRVRP